MRGICSRKTIVRTRTSTDIDGYRHRNKNISQVIAFKITSLKKAALVMEDDYRPLRNQESLSQN